MSLSARFDDINNRYRAHFAGQPRATRDLSVLEQLQGELQTLRTEAMVSEAGLVANIDERLSLFTREHSAIAELQAMGPDAVTASALSDWTSATRARYSRHFAGQRRATRDRGLLSGMLASQRQWNAEMDTLVARQGPAFMADLRTAMASAADLYERELATVTDARRQSPASERASVLATAANLQFATYRLHFAGKSRRTRRPALLERILGDLREIHADMVRLRDTYGVRTDAHQANITKVAERITHHEGELQAIRQARAGATPRERIGELGDEANGLFQIYRDEYAGKSRSTRDLTHLGEVCDQLHEVLLSMAELDRDTADETNRKNLGIVLQTVKRYEREHEQIKAAQG